MSNLLEGKNLTMILTILFTLLFVVFTFVNMLGAVVMIALAFATILIGVSQYGDLEA